MKTLFSSLSTLIFALVYGSNALACIGAESGPIQIQLGQDLLVHADILQEFYVVSSGAEPKLFKARFIRNPSEIFLKYYKARKKEPIALPKIRLKASRDGSDKYFFDMGDLEARKQMMDQGVTFEVVDRENRSTTVEIVLMQTKGACVDSITEKLHRP